MYAIRLELAAPDGTPPGEPAVPAVRAALTALLRALGARLDHARIRTDPGALAGICYVEADGLLTAERRLADACRALTGPGGLLSGWMLRRCEADPWIALALYEAPAES
ncbi:MULTISPECIES: hypothetical protein [Kitasatospora]|uniref:Uncharacterized protein n=2 Tax=Kitasatospora TaxID=2063 RepID=A0ABT1J5Y8_9ACTN|nr:hypothetical protein [Kitasatospora paracochleata]MCP2312538.1 hypothetical protein [Kitasatospora paracochleata]